MPLFGGVKETRKVSLIYVERETKKIWATFLKISVHVRSISLSE